MSLKSKISRRDFLGYTGMGIGALAAHVWIPKKAFASTPAAGTVKHLLIREAGIERLFREPGLFGNRKQRRYRLLDRPLPLLAE